MLPEVAIKAIESHHMLERGDRVLVAVSGGPDSAALLDVLALLQPRYGIELRVAHLNHMLRPEAMEEADFVRALAGERGFPITVGSADVRAIAAQEKLSIEHAARNARREFLLRTADAVGASRIALGHHADDRVETVLLRLLRGTGVDGLAGIRPVAGPIIRPLFDATRAQIEQYITERGLPYREDPSNRDPAFLRNRVRWELAPMLEELEPGFRSAVLRLSELAAQEAGWLRERAWAILQRALAERTEQSLTLRIASLARAAAPVQRRVVREAMRLLLGETMDVEQAHVEAALGLIRRGRTGAVVHLPRALTVERGYGALLLRVGQVERAEPIGEFALSVPGETEIAPLGISLIAQVLPRRQAQSPLEEPPNAVQLDYEKTPQPLMARAWRRGDRFQPLGMAGTMKLHDFFVNQKIPRAQRQRIPIITAGGEIAWIVGWRVDDRFKVTDATEAVLRLEMQHLRAGE